MVGKSEVADDTVPKTTPPPRAARWFLRLVLLTVTGFVSLGLCELATRLVAPQAASWLAIYRQLPDLPFYGFQPNARQTVDTGETHWIVVTNQLGHRVATEEQDTEGTWGARPWTLCLGDSFLFGHGVDHEQSFVGLLQRDRVDGMDYVNAGVPGYGPVQYRQVLDHCLRHESAPGRLLIATFLGNDFQDCVWNKQLPVTDGILGKRGSWTDTIKQNSHLYRLATRVYHQLVSHDGVDQPDHLLDDVDAWNGEFLGKAERTYRDEFAQIAEQCRLRGIDLRVVILPSREEVARNEDPGGEAPAGLSEARRRCRQILSDLGVEFIDVTDALCRQPYGEVFFHFDGHLTPRGHEIVSGRIMTALTPETGPATMEP